MITTRQSNDRGHANHGWLDSYHTFSFSSYYDPRHMGFRDLRVINEDRVQPGAGFPTHSHQDMEIISYVIEGALEHKDSMGNSSIIRPGEVQRMTAGTGVTHSEYNQSKEEKVHFLQIWIKPAQYAIPPGYEQKNFSDSAQPGELTLVASQDGRFNSVTVHQDVNLYVGKLESGAASDYQVPQGRHVWVQVVRGAIDVNGLELNVSDGAAISEEKQLRFEAKASSEFLVFDLN